MAEDFEKISNFLLAIGLDNKSYQETKRERWELDEVEVTIDTWPWIPTFVELEGESEESIKEIIKLLELEKNKTWEKGERILIQEIYDLDWYKMRF